MTINAMLKVLAEHARNERALQIYNAHCALSVDAADNVVHLLALKTCANSEARKRGEAILRRMNAQNLSAFALRDIELLSTAIDLNGHF